MTEEHYLRRELYTRMRTDSRLFDFLESGSLDGIWYWDLTRPDHEWMSPQFWQTFGYDPAEKQHLAAEWQDLIHPDDLATAMDNFERHCADPAHPYDQVVRYRHQDGSWVWVRCRGLVIRDDKGQPIRMLGAHTNVTELKRTELTLLDTQRELRAANEELEARIAARTAELVRANRELRLRNQSLEGFVTMASHDLKTPLRGIISAVGWLTSDLDGQIDADSQETLELLAARASRMAMLVDGILRYTTLTGDDDPHIEAVPASEVLQSVLADSGLVAEADVTVADELPVIAFDRGHLYQIFQNLLTNAVKFCDKERCRIRVTAEARSDEWRFTVADNGPGIEERHFERIFKMFKTLQTFDQVESSGIGLAVVKALLERADGRVWLDSTIGEGTRFHFAIPRRSGPD